MATAAQQEIVHRYYEMTTTGKMAEAEDLFSSDVTFHSYLVGKAEFHGLDQVRAAFERLLVAIPDHSVTVHEIFADGEMLTVRHTHFGTQTGPFGAIPATGKQVTVDGIELFRVQGGKITEFWAIDDGVGLFQQLGLLPPSPR